MNPSRFPRFLLLFCSLLVPALSDPSAAQDAKVALVIGNSSYTGEQALKNPANDAAAVAEALRGLGFQVIERSDLDIEGMDRAVNDFAEALSPNSLGFFFFAGHGIQSQGENYLIPLQADLESERELLRETLAANQVLEEMVASGASIRVVVLDCCRNNPLTRRWKTRSTHSPGLAKMPELDGTVIAYSTAANDVASDGAGDNSPYTRELVRELNRRPKEGLELIEVFRDAAQSVGRNSETHQKPYLYFDGTMPDYFLTDGDGSNPRRNEYTKLLDEFGAMRDQIEQLAKKPRPSPAPTSAQEDEDLAKMVAELVRQNQELMKKLEQQSDKSSPAPDGNTGENAQLLAMLQQLQMQNDQLQSGIPSSGADRNTGMIQGPSLGERVTAFLQLWETAWEAKNIDSYSRLYHHDFVGKNYSSRTGWKTMYRSSWLSDKRSKFARAGTIRVGVSNPTFSTLGNGRIKVEFIQTYNSGTYYDRGTKTLLLIEDPTSDFLILGEDFRP